ncbi:hypothetical protein ZWY2020_045768 [Hordeum vulgare]|nr:hypothetical protein ZWY2020_045768 [Hordeum vulgare]
MDHVEDDGALAVVRDEDNIISPGAMDPKNWRLHGPVNREGGSSQPPVRHIPLPLPLPASDTDGRYQCTKCPRKFPTPQSLGGHMSFHVKAKRVAEAQRVEAPPVDNIVAPMATAAIDLNITPPPLAAAAIDLSRAPTPPAAAVVPVVPPAAPNGNGVPRDFDLNVEIPWE